MISMNMNGDVLAGALQQELATVFQEHRESMNDRAKERMTKVSAWISGEATRILEEAGTDILGPDILNNKEQPIGRILNDVPIPADVAVKIRSAMYALIPKENGHSADAH